MTSPADRDEAIERLLKGRRTDARAAASGVCLDAEMLARWADGALSGSELANVDAHAATCDRCQALLAAMIRTEPSREIRAHGRFAWTLVRWGVPLGAAAALALWIAVDRDVVPPERTRAVEPAAASAPARPATSPPASSPDLEARQTPQAAVPVPQAREERGVRRDRAAAPDTFARNEGRAQSAPALQDAPSAAAPAAAAQAPTPAETPAPEAPPAEQSPTPPSLPRELAAPSPPSASPPAAKQIQTTPQAGAEQVPGGGLAETVTTTSAADARATQSRRAQAYMTWVDVPSPDPLVRWRFSPRGDVERSQDAGVTWTRERIGARAELLTGAAPSSSVCWLAGREGVVLRFTTAQGWQRVSLPVSATIVTIEATDAQNATVRVAGAGPLTTTDGGKTWH